MPTEIQQPEPWTFKSLDLYSVTDLRTPLLERLAGAGETIVDLSQVESCDCAGLQLLCAARKSARIAGKTLHIINLSSAIRTSMDSIGLDSRELTDNTQ
jgi:anti-anti-sigma factor